MHKKSHVFLGVNVGVVLIVIIAIHFYLSARFVEITLPTDFNNSKVTLSSQYIPSFLFSEKNYNRLECEHTGISIQVKKTWYFLTEHIGSSKICYITVEPLKKEGAFKTGVVLEIVDDYSDKTKIPVKEYAYYYIKDLPNNQLEVPIESFSNGSVSGFSTVLLQTDGIGQYDKKKFVTTIANSKTNTLYILSYETPIGEENTHRVEINTMISNIQLDTLH